MLARQQLGRGPGEPLPQPARGVWLRVPGGRVPRKVLHGHLPAHAGVRGCEPGPVLDQGLPADLGPVKVPEHLVPEPEAVAALGDGRPEEAVLRRVGVGGLQQHLLEREPVAIQLRHGQALELLRHQLHEDRLDGALQVVRPELGALNHRVDGQDVGDLREAGLHHVPELPPRAQLVEGERVQDLRQQRGLDPVLHGAHADHEAHDAGIVGVAGSRALGPQL
mmetsp:Transcript_35147/g.100393  ORF Transcript_35147/g.100393 Transcript_35147/m.100393 type:complete len:222 (-) Transcript_35147:158-823(-)